MKVLARAAALAFVLVGTVLSARPAHADLTICNQYRETIYTAYGFNNGTDWVSRGWWQIDPGQCVALISGALTNRYYYVYADTENGDYYWGGDYMFCISKPNAFEIVGDTDCNTGFFEIDTNGDTDVTQTLTP